MIRGGLFHVVALAAGTRRRKCDNGDGLHLEFDTSGNRFSANNFIKAGYRLYEPEIPWAWSHTLYWRRSLR